MDALEAIGTGGWEHESYDGCLYGPDARSSEERLAIYARYFNSVEVRATFWDDTLAGADAQRWLGAVFANKSFLFSVKLHSSFTHRRQMDRAAIRNVRSILETLAQGERLGALLLQFPFSFTNTSGTRYHLARIAEQFRGFPLFAELRHLSWKEPGLDSFLRDSGVSCVSSDFPRIRAFVSFASGLTGDTAYLRLHGRNERGWLTNGLDARYDYLYNGREIAELRRRVETLSRTTRRVIIIFNNTTGGKAIANALELASALHGGRSLTVPPATLTTYPRLERIALRTDGTGSLFEEGEYREAM